MKFRKKPQSAEVSVKPCVVMPDCVWVTHDDGRVELIPSVVFYRAYEPVEPASADRGKP